MPPRSDSDHRCCHRSRLAHAQKTQIEGHRLGRQSHSSNHVPLANRNRRETSCRLEIELVQVRQKRDGEFLNIKSRHSALYLVPNTSSRPSRDASLQINCWRSPAWAVKMTHSALLMFERKQFSTFINNKKKTLFLISGALYYAHLLFFDV